MAAVPAQGPVSVPVPAPAVSVPSPPAPGAPAPGVTFSCRRGDFLCFNNQYSDSQITTACVAVEWLLVCPPDLGATRRGCCRLWIWAALGVGCLVVFALLRTRLPLYIARLVSLVCGLACEPACRLTCVVLLQKLPNLAQDQQPPKIALRGYNTFWWVSVPAAACVSQVTTTDGKCPYRNWLVPVLTVSDARIAASAGLDCLVSPSAADFADHRTSPLISSCLQILTWTCALGVQLLLPVTILGCALCTPRYCWQQDGYLCSIP